MASMIGGFKRYIREKLYRPFFRVTPAARLREVLAYPPLSSKAAQIQLFVYYQMLARQCALPAIVDTGYRVFSQFDEDGILCFLFAALGTKSKFFVDIGSGDGTICSNCANLAINFGWHGLFIDSSQLSVACGRQVYSKHPDTSLFPPKFVCAVVKRENINEVIRGAGVEGEVDLLSIDIDGNDYWIWEALECIEPRVVVIETHVEFGLHNVVVPYDPEYVYPGRHPEYFGASPVAMARLADRKGYRLVAANRFGFNTIYVRNGEGDGLIPTVSVESILRHPRNMERFKLFEAIRGLPYIEG